MEKTKSQAHHIITKRIGNTTYKVAVYFSSTSKETLDKKIMRLIKNDMGAVS
ncbi:MAG: transposon-encoded TnpW family protein [Defluviitaleaceae bacterium]|nr:transposon-encoded TnpW family protein [Defluviitaleaceae bacterium]